MSERVSVAIQLADGACVHADVDVLLASRGGSWTLRVSGVELPRQEFGGEDLFEAMLALRRTLEAQGAQLLCAGARPEVYPSSMSRAGGARKCYVTRIGESATELVDVFAYAPPQAVGSIEQQQAFRARWVQSLR